MFQGGQQIRIAKSCTEASLGYAAATVAAYSEIVSSTLGVWADFARDMNRANEDTPARRASWFRAPGEEDRGRSSAARPRSLLRDEPRGGDPFAWQNNMAMDVTSWWFASPWPKPQWSPFGATPFDPLSAFMAFVPSPSASPAVWPGAFAMIAVGIPRSVAWPMAEANVAAMDAANRTVVAVREAFPAYRSDNGFASAQVWSPESMMQLMLDAPVGPAAIFPWLRAA